MIPFKKSKADLKKYYTVFLEFGMILSLLIFLGITQIPLQNNSGDVALTEDQETVKMEKVEQTIQEDKPPPPPRPPVPVQVPNDEVLEGEVPDIDAELNLNEEIEVPSQPPAEETEEEEEEEENFFVVVEQMPELKGGLQSLQEKIQYPDMARKAGIEGRVVIQFIVNEQGQVENPKVVRGIGGGCDKEALRVVKKANFEPGRQRGEPVRVQYSLPIVFRLQD